MFSTQLSQPVAQYPYIEHEMKDGCRLVRLPFMHGSFGPHNYEVYAIEALKNGVLTVRVVDEFGREIFWRDVASPRSIRNIYKW